MLWEAKKLKKNNRSTLQCRGGSKWGVKEGEYTISLHFLALKGSMSHEIDVIFSLYNPLNKHAAKYKKQLGNKANGINNELRWENMTAKSVIIKCDCYYNFTYKFIRKLFQPNVSFEICH